MEKKTYYLTCKDCKENIDYGNNLVRLQNLKKALTSGDDTAHTNHLMHIIDDEGNKIDG